LNHRPDRRKASLDSCAQKGPLRESAAQYLSRKKRDWARKGYRFPKNGNSSWAKECSLEKGRLCMWKRGFAPSLCGGFAGTLQERRETKERLHQKTGGGKIKEIFLNERVQGGRGAANSLCQGKRTKKKGISLGISKASRC